MPCAAVRIIQIGLHLLMHGRRQHPHHNHGGGFFKLLHYIVDIICMATEQIIVSLDISLKKIGEDEVTDLYNEISEELELPIGTVKAQLFRARELLLNILNHSSEKI